MEPLTIEDEAAMIEAGREFGAAARAGEVFGLVGDLGSGKTQFTKGLVAGAGCDAEVTSPTFALVQEYRGGHLHVFHFDLYRLESADELLSLGWDEYLDAGGICVVEWADKFRELLPPDTRWLRFRIEDDGTRSLTPHS